MIKTRKDLERYICMDEYALGRRYSSFRRVDMVLRFQRVLRYHEYYANNKSKSIFHKVMCYYYSLRHSSLGYRLGFDIPINVFAEGLRINHWGLIVVNPHVRIGRYCDIHQGVNIGVQGSNDTDCPIIGENVWIGPGVKIFGKIKIADKCQIGANAVVNKSFEEPGVSIAGVPARKISNNPNPYVRSYLI